MYQSNIYKFTIYLKNNAIGVHYNNKSLTYPFGKICLWGDWN